MVSTSEILTLKTQLEVADAASDPPAVIDSIPLYSDFFKLPETYQRIHVHLIGVRPKDPKDEKAGLHATTYFGYRSFFRHVNPFVVVETYGANTGSTDWFPIGQHKFLVRIVNLLDNSCTNSTLLF